MTTLHNLTTTTTMTTNADASIGDVNANDTKSSALTNGIDNALTSTSSPLSKPTNPVHEAVSDHDGASFRTNHSGVVHPSTTALIGVDSVNVANNKTAIRDTANDDTESQPTTTTDEVSITTPDTPSTLIRTGKRPSPWREPRTTGPPPPARESTNQKKGTGIQIDDCTSQQQKLIMLEKQKQRQLRRQKRKERRCAYLCSGSLTIHIPLSVTADLGVALRRGRDHRIAALYRHFPELKQHEPLSTNQTISRGIDDSVAATQPDVSPTKKVNTKKVLRHVPQPHEYSNVIDYLEAKYVQGVVISDDLEGSNNGGSNDSGDDPDDYDDEGQGSVYSETSFLDDTGLQRTIAEQVLGQTTTTKLELMSDNRDEDAAFFVNVGDLEVEETDLTQDMYDPINDTKAEVIKKKARKRKKISEQSNTDGKSIEPAKMKTKSINSVVSEKTTKESSTFKPSITSPKKKKIKFEETKSEPIVVSMTKNTKSSPGKAESIVVKNPVVLKLQKISSRKKDEINEYFNKLKALIEALNDEELPRKAKPKRTKIVVKVPPTNKPGDMITFENPYIPGKRLRAKVPNNTKAGETFKVTVPKPPDKDDEDDKLGEDGLARDHNKFNRDFYDVLDDYAKAYDDWCDAEGAYRRAIDDKTFTSHFMKRNKCVDLIPLFPTDTKTSITIEYLKKVIRRARQNKHKRELTLARQQTSFIEEHHDEIEQGSDSDCKDNNDETKDGKRHEDSSDEDDVQEKVSSSPIKHSSINTPKISIKKAKATRTAILPSFSRTFQAIKFAIRDFKEVL